MATFLGIIIVLAFIMTAYEWIKSNWAYIAAIFGIVVLCVLLKNIWIYITNEKEKQKRQIERDLRIAEEQNRIEELERIKAAEEQRKQFLEEQKNKLMEQQRNALLSEHGVPAYSFNEIAQSTKDFAGCYILYNEDTSEAYVGQATRVLERIKKHLSGRGNGEVYADYKYGDYFIIIALPLSQWKNDNLNEMESFYIGLYNSRKNGYNKTKGNRP